MVKVHEMKYRIISNICTAFAEGNYIEKKIIPIILKNVYPKKEKHLMKILLNANMRKLNPTYFSTTGNLKIYTKHFGKTEKRNVSLKLLLFSILCLLLQGHYLQLQNLEISMSYFSSHASDLWY